MSPADADRIESKLDRIIDMQASTQERVASVEATLEQWRINIQRFHDHTMPVLYARLDRHGERLDDHDKDLSALKVKVSVLAAGAGAVAGGLGAWIRGFFGH